MAATKRAARHGIAADGTPSWLHQLPGLAQQAIAASLCAQDRGSLRLACRSAAVLVDTCASRLRISSRELLAGGGELQQRFQGVTQLELPSIEGSTQYMQINPAPWPAVTSLHACGGSLSLMIHVGTSFRNLQHCCLDQIRCPAEDCVVPQLLSQWLPRLESLQLTRCKRRLDDQNLAALARSPVLTALQGRLSRISEAGCSALAAMTALTSLRLEYNAAQRMIRVDLSALTRLTQLEWGALGGDAANDEEGWGIIALQLPTSLVQLRMEHLPEGVSARAKPAPLPLMPHLTSLILTEQCIWEDELLTIAASCPALASLQLYEATLCPDCHTAPLTALTSLTCTQSLHAEAGLKLAKVFPQLRSLVLCSLSGSGTNGLPMLEGATCLERLDTAMSSVFGRSSSAMDVALEPADFAALAALPLLDTLRLDMTPKHLEGLCMLSQLRKVDFIMGWGCWRQAGIDLLYDNGWFPTAQAMQVALLGCQAPPQLQTAAVSIEDVGDSLVAAQCRPHESSFLATVDAVISLLARAPALTKVHWTCDSVVAGLTAARLAALAASPTIQHIVINVDIQHADTATMCVLTSEQWLGAMQQLRNHGLEVQVLLQGGEM